MSNPAITALTGQPAALQPAINAEQKANKYEYLCLDATKAFFKEVVSENAAYTSVLAKIALIAFPVIAALVVLEAAFDLTAAPITFVANCIAGPQSIAPAEDERTVPELTQAKQTVVDPSTIPLPYDEEFDGPLVKTGSPVTETTTVSDQTAADDTLPLEEGQAAPVNTDETENVAPVVEKAAEKVEVAPTNAPAANLGRVFNLAATKLERSTDDAADGPTQKNHERRRSFDASAVTTPVSIASLKALAAPKIEEAAAPEVVEQLEAAPKPDLADTADQGNVQKIVQAIEEETTSKVHPRRSSRKAAAQAPSKAAPKRPERSKFPTNKAFKAALHKFNIAQEARIKN